jgi:hypothetical protein
MQISPPSRRDKFYRFTGKVTLGILTLLLGFSAIGFGLGRFLPLGDDHYVNIESSPSGYMKAALISRSGGGAISPYCTEAIAVALSAATEKEIMTQEFEIYSSNECDTFSDHSPSPVVEWVSDTKLKVSFSINKTAASMKTVQLKKRDASGQVSIDFTIRP